MPGIFDHILAALLLLVFPVWILLRGAREMEELAENPSDRLGTYRRTMLYQWAAALAIVLIWWSEGRAWTQLGIGFSWRPGFFVALALAAGATILLRAQLQRVRRDAAMAARLREQLHELRGFVPTTRREITAFRAMALTAGVCEELAFRGFALFYLAAFMPMPWAVLVMMAAFGCAHLYQGKTAAAQIAAIGGIAALLYLLSGSLWVPMALHVLMDVTQLSTARAALANTGRVEPA